MKIKTAELTGAALDWAVTRCEHPEIDVDYFLGMHRNIHFDSGTFMFSTDWAQGGPIIEREKLWVEPTDDGEQWWSTTLSGRHEGEGKTPLVAAMRCHVSSKMGDEIEVPEEIMP